MAIPLFYQNPATGVSAPSAWVGELAVTANTTLTGPYNGWLITNANAAGAVTITLPAIGAGYLYGVRVYTAQNVTVASAEGNNIVWDGTVVANSLAFSTGSHQVGGHLVFMTNANGTKWFVEQRGPSGCTVTQA